MQEDMDAECLKKGERILANGGALGDTSGRTKNLGEKSVFALASNKFEFTVIMFSSEKKKIFPKLDRKHGEKRAQAIMHTVKIYYAIKEYIKNCPSFHICNDGFNEGLLKHYLREFLKGNFHEHKINFGSLRKMFGKHNIADRLARRVNKEGKKATLILTERHFLELKLI